MEERPFLDKTAEPTEEKLKYALENSSIYYEGLMEIAESFSKDWNFLLIVLRVAIGVVIRGAVQRSFLSVPWIWIELIGLKFYSLSID